MRLRTRTRLGIAAVVQHRWIPGVTDFPEVDVVGSLTPHA